MLHKVRVREGLGPPPGRSLLRAFLPSLLPSFRAPLFAAGLVAASAAALSLPPSARAESPAKNRSPVAAEKLMLQGAAAITAKDFSAAQSSLTEAYQAYQSPKILYYLGALRAASQKMP